MKTFLGYVNVSVPLERWKFNIYNSLPILFIFQPGELAEENKGEGFKENFQSWFIIHGLEKISIVSP